jgi:hypothetical protein
MAVADDPLLARLGLQIGMLCEKLSNLRFDRLGQQRTRAMAQDLGQAIGKGPWLARLITLLSDTAYHSFIGEVEALNTTTIRRLTPSGRHQLLAIAPYGDHVAVSIFHAECRSRQTLFSTLHPGFRMLKPRYSKTALRLSRS